MFQAPYVRPGLFGKGFSLAKGINWSGLLDGTQKTLGVINQAIPIVYQVKPIISNAKTMFKIADEVRSSKPSSNVTSAAVKENKPINTEKPIFYI